MDYKKEAFGRFGGGNFGLASRPLWSGPSATLVTKVAEDAMQSRLLSRPKSLSGVIKMAF